MSYYNRFPERKDQNASTNLDQDLRTSRETKYQSSEPEIKQWVFDTLGVSHEDQLSYKEKNYDLLDILKDGEYLCKLGNLIPIDNLPTRKYKNSKMPFVQMENISFFLATCERIGVPHDEIFQTVDLFERKDPYQIIITLISFSREAHGLDPVHFPNLIGPKIVKVKPPVPKKPIKFSTYK